MKEREVVKKGKDIKRKWEDEREHIKRDRSGHDVLMMMIW
jgi:hypothetical protein